MSTDEQVAAGDRACEWLSRQPEQAVWRQGDSRTVNTLARHYRAAAKDEVGRARRTTLAAWEHLCPRTAVLVGPRPDVLGYLPRLFEGNHDQD